MGGDHFFHIYYLILFLQSSCEVYSHHFPPFFRWANRFRDENDQVCYNWELSESSLILVSFSPIASWIEWFINSDIPVFFIRTSLKLGCIFQSKESYNYTLACFYFLGGSKIIIVIRINRALDLKSIRVVFKCAYTLYLPRICTPKWVYLKKQHSCKSYLWYIVYIQRCILVAED